MRRRAFSLIELLVVVAVVGLLLAVLVPSLGKARAASRRANCLSNLHQLGVATALYVNESQGYFWRYYTDRKDPEGVTGSKGRMWWFGFEPNGPAAAGTQNRPLDKSQSPLAPFTANLSDLLQCPDFPYDDSLYFPKFDQHAASYGYNISGLGPVGGTTASVRNLGRKTAEVFEFADGVQFDFGATFNEGHYLTYTPNASSPSGYAHFRHPAGKPMAQVLFVDGHTESQAVEGPTFKPVAGMPSGNLHGEDGGKGIYGVP